MFTATDRRCKRIESRKAAGVSYFGQQPSTGRKGDLPELEAVVGGWSSRWWVDRRRTAAAAIRVTPDSVFVKKKAREALDLNPSYFATFTIFTLKPLFNKS